MSDPLLPRGLSPAKLLCQWDSPGKNTGVGCESVRKHAEGVQGSSWPRDGTCISLLSPALAGKFFTTSATWETPYIYISIYIYIYLYLSIYIYLPKFDLYIIYIYVCVYIYIHICIYIYIYIYIVFRFFSILGYHKILSI